jgi:nucleoside-diphosphate-sugar epimerase
MVFMHDNIFELSSDVLILGCGYVGSYFLNRNPNSFYTNRKIIASNCNNTRQFYFDLNDKSSWDSVLNINSNNILFTFPVAKNMNDIDNLILFFNNYLKDKNVIILSTTSAYKVNYTNEYISEESDLLLDNPRFYAEDILRNMGSLILHLSGIIGPNRTPLNWYRKNLVSSGENILNYIYIDDIIFFIEELFKKYKPYERFNITSQDYKTHNEISFKLKERFLLDNNFSFSCNDFINKSKRVNSSKILKYLNLENYNFKKYPEDINF